MDTSSGERLNTGRAHDESDPSPDSDGPAAVQPQFDESDADSASESVSEEDEEEEETESKRKRSSKESSGESKRRRLRNQFLDVEAEDDEEDGDDFEDEDEDGEDGFVQDERAADDAEDGGKSESARVYRQVDRRENEFSDFDAETLAQKYRERYGRNNAAYGKSSSRAAVPQQLLLPGVEDPPIFGLNCRIGKEKESVRALLRKLTSLAQRGQTTNVFSCFQRDAFPGRIYVEAASEAAALKAVAGVPNLYTSNGVLKVPIKEYPDMFRVAKNSGTELVPGKYVRVRRGKYAGDLAVVIDLSENGLEARLKLLPRLNYGRSIQIAQNKSKERPPARLFSLQEAQQHDPRAVQPHGANVCVYLGDEYVKGYLHKDFKLSMLDVDGAAPTLAEIAALQDGGDDGLDLASIGNELNRGGAQTTKFSVGERVEIVSGEQNGLKGRVIDSKSASNAAAGSSGTAASSAGAGSISSSNDELVTVRGDKEFASIQVTVPSSYLRKHFSVGDHVRVVRGSYKDDTGLVVAADGAQVTLLSDAAQNEITVFARDLRAASDTSVKNQLAGFAIQDLVQLNAQSVGCVVDVQRDTVTVLSQNGQLFTLKPESIAMKARSQRVATDRNGNEIQIGDTVKELTGEQLTGAVIHIFHQYVFMHNRERQENLGVFVNTASQIETIATKTARDKGLDLGRMNPAAQTQPKSRTKAAHFNSRRIIGQHVSIGPGSGYKGMKGIVRDASETAARVELEARNKVVSVDVQKLLFKQPHSNQFVTLNEFMHPYGRSGNSNGPNGPNGPNGFNANGPNGPNGFNGNGPNGPNGGRTPGFNAGGRTPAWNGGRTPAWNGGRTPAWNGSKTPAWNGARTPAWNGGGGKTPAWNGGRTPAWNGAKTPAWNGGKTPAWSADAPDGGKTPAWSTESGKTPAWTDSSRTPGWSERGTDDYTSGKSFFSQQPEEDAVVQYDD